MMRAFRFSGGALLLVVLLLNASCVDSCRPERPPHHSVQPLLEPPELFEKKVSSLTAGFRPDGRPAALARSGGGNVYYVVGSDDSLQFESVIDEALPGVPSLEHGDGGEVGAAVIVEARHETAPLLAALPESPRAKVAGEGELRLLQRRSPGLWRSRSLAARALAPAISLGEDRIFHLVFLQPEGGGSFVVVYARLDGSSVLREEVGRRAMPITPHISLFDGRPLVTYVIDSGGPVLVQAAATSGGVFLPARELPRMVLGEPGAAPEKIVWLGEEGTGWLVFTRSVQDERLRLPGGRRVLMDVRAKHALLLARIEEWTIAHLEVLGTTTEVQGASLIMLDRGVDAGELLSLAPAIGGQVLLFDPLRTTSGAGDASPWKKFAGQGGLEVPIVLLIQPTEHQPRW